MKILVCGGAGYIGSHTIAELLEKGYEVIAIDNLGTGHEKAVFPDAKLFVGDLRDENFMDKVFRENKINAVIDFAAYSLVGESVSEPLKYYENNMYSTLCLLKTMNKHKVQNIVFSSTAAVYGEPENIPILEKDKTFPKNPYGQTKLAVEDMLKWCDGAYGIKHAVLRYFNAAGAHKTGVIGEDHNPETHLIPNVLKAALGEAEQIKIFGTDYDTPDGTCVRDYVHVTDLANAHILSVEKIMKDNVSVTYNLGSGTGFSVREVIETAKKVTGRTIKVEECERRPGDPSTLIASSEKIKRELNWNPKYTEMEYIISSAWKWHSNHPKGY